MAAVNLGTGVKPGSDASVSPLEYAGEAILAGQIVYRSATDGKIYKAVNTSQAAASAVGVALASAPTLGQPLAVQWGGTVTNTATMILGDVLVISATAGSVCPIADILTGAWMTSVGIAVTTTSLQLLINRGNVQHA